jgi:type IV pilus assembly protein PilY2
MGKLLFILALTGGLFTQTAALAQTFEASGAVRDINLAQSKISVNDRTYLLPNSVTESLLINAGPVIYQLQLGTVIAFSGTESGGAAKIDSVAILRQPSPEEVEELLREQANEQN